MKWTEIAGRANILMNVPMAEGDRKLKGESVAELILLRVAYERKRDELRQFMQDVAKRLKPEGYDEREAKVLRMRDIEERAKAAEKGGDAPEDVETRRATSPTPEELEEAKETRADVLDPHAGEKEALHNDYLAAQGRPMDEEEPAPAKGLSRAAFADICSLLGTEGDTAMLLPGQEKPVPVAKAQLLTWIAQMVED